MAGQIVERWQENQGCPHPGCSGSIGTRWARDEDGNQFVEGHVPCGGPHQ